MNRRSPFLTRFEQDAEHVVGILTRGEPKTEEEWKAVIRAARRLLAHADA
jgi:hypothetical protein